MCIGFLLLILLGGFLLSLPWAAKSGSTVGVGNALFTSVSAVCVTGLTVVDTGTTYSLFGQIVMLLLIQTGGLGFMTFATLVMAALGKRITLRDRLLMRESLNTKTLGGLVQLIGWYGLLTLLIEGAGAILLSIRLVPLLGWARGLWFSIWHSVSAFCNAGFDLFGDFSGLTLFSGEPLLLLTIALLIILGGTGFAVISEVCESRFCWRKLSLHAKNALLTYGGLLLVGMVAFLLLEWNNPGTLGSQDGFAGRMLSAFFQAASLRTAGFSSMDVAALTDAAKLAGILLMLVGANPASTGGGVKTTTVAVLVLTVYAVIQGREDTIVMGRRLPRELVRRALAVASVTTLVFLAGTLALTIAEAGCIPFVDLLFESASAIATVGLSSAGTPELSECSRLSLALLMYVGRVGPLTLAYALAGGRECRGGKLRYPEADVTIG